MHGVFTRVLLHQLLEEAGGDRAEAARRVGVGRTTMYRWIKAGLLDQELGAIQARYAPRPPEVTKLEKYKPLIETRLQEFPRLRTRCSWTSADEARPATTRCARPSTGASDVSVYRKPIF
jgi:transposase-like protein